MRHSGPLSILLAGCALAFAACTPSPESIAAAAGADACDAHPLVKALPAAVSIAGVSRNSPTCDWSSASVDYGDWHDEDMPHGCRITISDFQAEIPADLRQPEATKAMREALEFKMGAHRGAIELHTKMYEAAHDSGEWLNTIGGPQHLPVVGRFPDDGPYTIPVPSVQDGPGEVSLIGLLHHERYGVTINCLEKIHDQAGARNLFAPWIKALNFEALP